MQKCLPTVMYGEIGLPCWEAGNGNRYSLVILDPFLPFQMQECNPSAFLCLPQHPGVVKKGTVTRTCCQKYILG